MLTLLVALAVSQQAPRADQPLLPLPAPVEQLTPPPPPPPVVEPDPVFEPEPRPPVQARTRSARLLTGPEPRVSTGALVGRVAMATGLGFTGAALGLLAGAIFSGVSQTVYLVVGTMLAIGLGVVATAVGAALFGRNFYNDLRAALPVAALVVGPAVLLGMLAALLLPGVGTVVLIALPLAAMIATPLIVQARKPEEAVGGGGEGPRSRERRELRLLTHGGGSSLLRCAESCARWSPGAQRRDAARRVNGRRARTRGGTMDRRDLLKFGAVAGVSGSGCASLLSNPAAVGAADMGGFLAALDGALEKILPQRSFDAFLPRQHGPELAARARYGEDLTRKTLRSLLLVGTLGELPPEQIVHEGVQQRLRGSMGEFDDAMFGMTDMLEGLGPTERASVSKALRDDPELGMRIMGTFDQEAAAMGISFRQRTKLRSISAQACARLRQSPDSPSASTRGRCGRSPRGTARAPRASAGRRRRSARRCSGSRPRGSTPGVSTR